MAKIMDRFEGDYLMKSYYIFSFIHLTSIYSQLDTTSMVVSKIITQQGNTHRESTHLFGMSTGVSPCLLAILCQFQITVNSFL